MCGGISAGFSLLQKEQLWRRQLAFNVGRVASYAAAARRRGALGSAALTWPRCCPRRRFSICFRALSCSARVASHRFPSLVELEPAGRAAVAPHSAARIALAARRARCRRRSRPAWRGAGCRAAWSTARCSQPAFAGGATQGALAMAAFGAGTLPWLLIAGVAAARLRQWTALQRVRRAGGLILVGVGAWGLAHGVEQTILCL
jgi:hypothetical protein